MGASGALSQLAMFANIFVGARLRGRHGRFYGITMLYRKDPKPLREDLSKVFSLLADKKIDPLVTETFPLLDAAKALIHWKSLFADEVAAHAKRLAAESSDPSRVTLAHYRQAAQTAVQFLPAASLDVGPVRDDNKVA